MKNQVDLDGTTLEPVRRLTGLQREQALRVGPSLEAVGVDPAVVLYPGSRLFSALLFGGAGQLYLFLVAADRSVLAGRRGGAAPQGEAAQAACPWYAANE
jgi:hypothetical protein